jgi:hypothetical protein
MLRITWARQASQGLGRCAFSTIEEMIQQPRRRQPARRARGQVVKLSSARFEEDWMSASDARNLALSRKERGLRL